MADVWTGARAPRWIVEHLNDADQPLSRLPVEGGDVKVAAFARLGGSASLTISVSDAQGINWFRDRIAITYDPGIATSETIPMGVYLFDSPTLNQGLVPTWDVELLTKMAVVDQDEVEDTYSLPEGSPIIPAVVELIESTGETRISATESEAVTSSALAFEAGTPKLTIINDLLTSANYSALWADGAGQFRVEPYIEPSARPLARTFAEGQASIHKPDWSREQDILSVPNRVVVISPGTDEEPPIIGIAENVDPDSPFSIPSRGRIISRTEEVSDMSSVEAAEAHAERLLVGGMAPQATLSVEHAIVPLDPHSLVRFVANGETRLATVREMNFDLSFDSQCDALWREL